MVNSISVKDLKEKLAAKGEFFLLDVREEFEHEAFNIGGKNIPLGEVMQRAQEIPKDKTVIVYCRKGFRSEIAIHRLQQRFGLANLINLAGGTEAWRKV